MNEEQAGKLYDALTFMFSAPWDGRLHRSKEECVARLRECFEVPEVPKSCSYCHHGAKYHSVLGCALIGCHCGVPEGAPPIPEKGQPCPVCLGLGTKRVEDDSFEQMRCDRCHGQGFIRAGEPIPDKEPEAPWRPIESAPKDGTRVLLWTVGPEVGSFERDYWFSSGNWLIHPKYWQPIVKPSQTTVEPTAPTEKGSASKCSCGHAAEPGWIHTETFCAQRPAEPRECECGHPQNQHVLDAGHCLVKLGHCTGFSPRVSVPKAEDPGRLIGEFYVFNGKWYSESQIRTAFAQREFYADENARLRAELRAAREEAKRMAEDHHAPGKWPDCPQCSKWLTDDHRMAHENERLKTEVAGGKFAFENLDAVFQLALAEAQGERDAARNECDELKARLSARRDPAK